MPTLNKLEYLDETKQQIKNALNTNFNSQIQDTDTFRSYVTKIKNIYSNWPKVTDEDSQINLTPTRKGKMNLTLKSTELIQDTTPTPSSPVDVNVITGDNNVMVENKNLFKPYTNTGSVTSNGVVYTMNSDNTVTINGTATGNTWVEILENFRASVQTSTTKYLNLDSTKTYTIKANIISGTYTGQTRFYTQINSSGGEVYSNLDNSSSITNSDGLYRSWFGVFSGDVFDNLKIGIQLEEGSTATEYVEHQEQNYPITLSSLEYCKIGDYGDQIFKNTTNSPYYDNTLIENEWYLKKNIGKVTFDGSEEWNNGNEQGGYYSYFLRTDIIKLNSNNELLVMSDRFVGYANPSDVTNTSNIGITTRPSTSGQGFYIRSNLTNINDWLPWLMENKPKVYYVLATPTYIHISQADYPVLREQLENLYNNAKSYDGQTNITQTNDNLPFIINASALMKGDNLHE